jgi:hypothetical protein
MQAEKEDSKKVDAKEEEIVSKAEKQRLAE